MALQSALYEWRVIGPETQNHHCGQINASATTRPSGPDDSF